MNTSRGAHQHRGDANDDLARKTEEQQLLKSEFVKNTFDSAEWAEAKFENTTHQLMKEKQRELLRQVKYCVFGWIFNETTKKIVSETPSGRCFEVCCVRQLQYFYFDFA